MRLDSRCLPGAPVANLRTDEDSSTTPDVNGVQRAFEREAREEGGGREGGREGGRGRGKEMGRLAKKMFGACASVTCHIIHLLQGERKRFHRETETPTFAQGRHIAKLVTVKTDRFFFLPLNHGKREAEEHNRARAHTHTHARRPNTVVNIIFQVRWGHR